MRYLLSLLMLLLTLSTLKTTNAQQRTRHVDLEVEPIAYILDGVGATAGYQHGAWTYSIEAYGGLTLPESLHGNEGFEAGLGGIEFQAERFLSGSDGWYVGPEFGISRIEVSRSASDNDASRIHYSLGVRGGYQWQPGLGNLYLNPLAGISVALNARDIQIGNSVFEIGFVTPFATVGIGWSF